MGLQRSFNLVCDSCGVVHKTTCPTPRRARANAKRDGWARRQVVVRQYQMPNWIETPNGLWIQAGEGTHAVYDTTGRDFCKQCIEADEV